jgi:hypothetical protein
MLAIDLYCGLGGWCSGLLAEGFTVVGFDIERNDYGSGGYPGHLVIQDATTLHGSQFKDAALIVASPPCTEYSYMAMPWSRSKQIALALHGDAAFPEGYTGSRTIAELNRLFDACFRIQREACEAAGRYIPMIVENVRGAQSWVGRAKANFGSYYLWGDVGMVGKRVVAGVPQFGQSVTPIKAFKTSGMDWNNRELYGQDFTRIAGQQAAQKRNPDGTDHGSGSWFKIADSKNRGARSTMPGIKPASGREWFAGEGTMGRMSSSSNSRKAASAEIARIPFALASYIARSFSTSFRVGQLAP